MLAYRLRPTHVRDQVGGRPMPVGARRAAQHESTQHRIHCDEEA